MNSDKEDQNKQQLRLACRLQRHSDSTMQMTLRSGVGCCHIRDDAQPRRSTRCRCKCFVILVTLFTVSMRVPQIPRDLAGPMPGSTKGDVNSDPCRSQECVNQKDRRNQPFARNLFSQSTLIPLPPWHRCQAQGKAACKGLLIPRTIHKPHRSSLFRMLLLQT